ncbi:MAG: YciI family protein [Chitinophagaceae bacterium]|nr:YciI family protein [Chitinophagaceae bacterium]
MKKLLTATGALLLMLGARAQTNKPAAEKPKYEMKQYWFVMLSKGKDRDKITDTAIINRLQAGHMANMEVMAAAGKLMVAGPFGDDGHWRGIFIFDAVSKEEVEKLLQTDPAIKAGRLDYEIHPWWTARGTVFK